MLKIDNKSKCADSSMILLKNGIRFDTQESVDLLINNQTIEKIAPDIAEAETMEVIDLEGKTILPGLIDMQVHLREPGGESKETLETGLKAAARGGFTTVAAMPNTTPVTDNIELISSIKKKVKELSLAEVKFIPAMTKEMMQKELADYVAYKRVGIIAITDDGRGIADDQLMESIFIEAAKNGLSVLQHCEFFKISDGGSFHAGQRAKDLGVKGILSASEYEMIRRDIDLLRQHGGHYHVLHLSTKEGVELVANAKKEGLNITCEVTPHHLLLCDEDILEVDANFKMNPPLRTSEDKKALVKGLVDGVIDMISTDHAPHTKEDKAKDIDYAPFGIVGLETAFALLYSEFVLKGIITFEALVDRMSGAPARIFKLNGGVLEEGVEANFTVVDLDNSMAVDSRYFLSKGRNTPFEGWELLGWPVLTMYKGKKVWIQESV